MSNDLQMARGEVPGGYNLAVGEPVVVQRRLTYPDPVIHGPLTYPTMEGHRDLLDELRILHPRGEIVITNGAKQALSAAFYAYGRTRDLLTVRHKPPYWPSYPTLAGFGAFAFNDEHEPHPGNDIRVITSPNNPDGEVDRGGECEIWDAVYAHWMYGWHGYRPKHEVAVYSASKLLGLSGARVGWLVTEDKALAAAARKYVELTTSGVSVPSQVYVAYVLRCMRNDPTVMSKMGSAREDMRFNGINFTRCLRDHVEQVMGVPKSGQGMFAYFTARDPERFAEALAKAKVVLVTGAACGDPVPGRYRMNMAHDLEYTLSALQAIEEHLL